MIIAESSHDQNASCLRETIASTTIFVLYITIIATLNVRVHALTTR